MPSQPGENRGKCLGEFESRSVKTRDAIIIFRPNKEKDNIGSAYLHFNFFHETVNSHNLEIANHIAHVIFVLHGATHL